jgi:hypothetical protein
MISTTEAEAATRLSEFLDYSNFKKISTAKKKRVEKPT